jgi:hypothetical protein
MRLGEAYWAFWQREVDVPRESERRAAEARAAVTEQEQARQMYWRLTKRLNRYQQRQERRQGKRR